MDLKQITIVVELQEDILLNDTPISARQFYQCDRLADELRNHTQTKITIVENSLKDIASFAGYILWFRAENRETGLGRQEDQFKLPRTFWHRVVLMSVRSKGIYNLLNTYNFAGAVDRTNYIRWQMDASFPVDFYGLRLVTQEMTGLEPQVRGRYALVIDDSLGLVGKIIHYLAIYDDMISLMPEQLHPSESDPKWPLIWDILKKEGEKQNLNGVNLSQSDLSSINLKQVELVEANLSQSNWSFAYLQEADLQGANLTKAKFVQTNLARANFRSTVLIETDLSKAVLLGANLEETDLSTAILTDALYDQHTKWPKGFDPEKAGAIFKSERHKL